MGIRIRTPNSDSGFWLDRLGGALRSPSALVDIDFIAESPHTQHSNSHFSFLGFLFPTIYFLLLCTIS